MCEIGTLGVPDRYVDAFCGRVPSGVIPPTNPVA